MDSTGGRTGPAGPPRGVRYMEEMLLTEVPLIGTLALGVATLAMVVAFVVCIPRWVGRPKTMAKREPLKKAA